MTAMTPVEDLPYEDIVITQHYPGGMYIDKAPDFGVFSEAVLAGADRSLLDVDEHGIVTLIGANVTVKYQVLYIDDVLRVAYCARIA